MQNKDKKQFQEVMTVLAEIYNKELSAAIIDVYWQLMKKEMTIEEFKKKAEIIMKTKQYFPTPSEFLEIVDEDTQAMRAWRKVDFAYRYYGYYHSIQFDDPVIHSAIEMLGGWDYIYTRDDYDWLMKDFIKCYKAVRTRQSHPPLVLGWMDKENLQKGYIASPKSVVNVEENDGILKLIDSKKKLTLETNIIEKRKKITDGK